jgi:uncharacterized protein DUF5703
MISAKPADKNQEGSVELLLMMNQFLLVTTLATAAFGQHAVDAYNVVWNSPSKDSSGSMPLGNGDIGTNVWVEENGDLLLYISKTDAWSENARLLKLGRVRLRLTPNPFVSGQPFRQTLKLHSGEINIEAGQSGPQTKLKIWADALNPVVNIEAET